MTPTATRLKARLDDRRQWFHNEWLFKWHHIGGQRPIAIDTFDGRSAHYSGIGFEGSPRLIYWDAIVRGVRKEITDQFAWADNEVRNYNAETALRAIDECAGQLASFVRAIRRAAVQKDRILRGNGVSFPPENDAGRWEGTSDGEIQAQADALKAALPTHQTPDTPALLRKPLRAWWEDNQGWLGPAGWIIGAIGTGTGIIALLM